jgi:hypothetical protein
VDFENKINIRDQSAKPEKVLWYLIVVFYIGAIQVKWVDAVI